jgi:hypothetical protein
MDYREMAAVLRRLLGLYEGVTIEHLRTHPSGYATATLRLTNPASLARLARCAADGNVALFVWADSPGTTEEEWASPDRVRYELRAEADPKGEESPTNAQLLCAHMIGDLIRRRLLDEAEGRQFLVRWGWES